MNVARFLGAFSSAANILGGIGFKSASLLVFARRTTTAMLNLIKCCWLERFRSTVIKTSKLFCAKASSWPFLIVAHPICGTVLTVWPFNSCTKRRSMHSSSSSLTLGRFFSHPVIGFFQDSNHLRFFNGRKPFQEITNRFSGFQVVEQCFHGNPGIGKNKCSAHYIGGGADNFLLHAAIIR